jgi:hypothetical protein
LSLAGKCPKHVNFEIPPAVTSQSRYLALQLGEEIPAFGLKAQLPRITPEHGSIQSRVPLEMDDII